VSAGALATLRVDTERMASAAQDPMLLATDLAEALVRADLPFREAHQTVGRIVKHCLAKDLDLRSLSREDLQAFHPAFTASAAELLSLDRALEERAHIGGTARERVIEALDAAEARIAREKRELEARGEKR
jgi:argininosuccinate lyase